MFEAKVKFWTSSNGSNPGSDACPESDRRILITVNVRTFLPFPCPAKLASEVGCLSCLPLNPLFR